VNNSSWKPTFHPNLIRLQDELKSQGFDTWVDTKQGISYLLIRQENPHLWVHVYKFQDPENPTLLNPIRKVPPKILNKKDQLSLL
jgi:hypothetical protein